jgi:hypothetical protein
VACSDRGGCENHSRRGVEELTPVVFPDAKHLEAHLVSERDRFEQLAEMFCGIDCPFRDTVKRCRYETIYANLHK